MEKITEEEIVFVKNAKEGSDLSWQEITDKFNKKFKSNKGLDGVKKIYYRYGEIAGQEDFNIKTLKQLHRRKNANSFTAKENRVILDYLNQHEDILESIKSAVKESSRLPVKIYKPVKSSNKENMTMELMFSDVHYGKKTEKVDLAEIRRRVQKISRVVVDEINRESKNFNVHRLILSMIGDIIEHADFHGKESMRSSEFGTSRQVFEAINSIYIDLIVPIASTGIAIDILAVTGNHDRVGEDKTYNNPGDENLTYIIYKSLELLAARDQLKNVKFHISKGNYASIAVYQNTLLIEHGDEAKNINRDTLNNLLSKRQNQINRIIDFYRIGHWHEATSYGQGRIMVNGSVPGQDSYAEVKGFSSEAIQILNYYVETKTRPSCFFRSFPIYLERKENKK
jgi:hypothetical protein